MDSPPLLGIPARRLSRALGFVALAACLAVAGACTSDTSDPPDDTSSPTNDTASSPRAGAPTTAPDGNGGSKRTVATSTEIADPGTARTASGSVPAYVEIAEASVRGGSDGLTFVVRLAGTIPQKMPDRATSLRASFRLLTDEGGRYLFEAQASDRGWVASASGERSEGFPGRLKVSGDQILLEIDRSYLPVPTFRWLVNVAWTRTRGGSSYGFDVAPEGGFARFPARS